MRSRRRWIPVAVAACLMTACGSDASRYDGAPLSDVRFGFADNAVTQGLVTPAQDARLLARAGARVARVQLDWRFVEPRRGEYRFETFDALYRAYRARGVRMLLIFAFAPPWAAAQACPQETCLQAPARDRYGDAARFVGRLARRYPDLAGIEVWNEPNTPYFWGGPPDPEAYTALLKACAAAIEAVAPDMPVVGGSLVNAASAGAIDPADFLAAMLRDGAADSLDALSIHPYPDPGDTSGDSARDAAVTLVDALRAGGADDLPVWVTELGISTTGEDAVTDAEQVTALTAAIRHLRRIPQVRMILVHTLVDPARGAENRESGFGAVTTDLRPKPAYCALAAAAGGRAACADG